MSTTETRLQSGEAIQKLKDLAQHVHICMFTTTDENGELSSRPMYTSEIDEDGNIWFFTNEFSKTVQEVSKDNIVHLIYSHPGKNIYVDVKGSCTLVIDPKKMEALWDEHLKQWFPEGLQDPNLCLVKVQTQSGAYWNHATSRMGQFLHQIKAAAKGDRYRESEKGKLSLDK